jgi:hypothetical protein
MFIYTKYLSFYDVAISDKLMVSQQYFADHVLEIEQGRKNPIMIKNRTVVPPKLGFLHEINSLHCFHLGYALDEYYWRKEPIYLFGLGCQRACISMFISGNHMALKSRRLPETSALRINIVEK